MSPKSIFLLVNRDSASGLGLSLLLGLDPLLMVEIIRSLNVEMLYGIDPLTEPAISGVILIYRPFMNLTELSSELLMRLKTSVWCRIRWFRPSSAVKLVHRRGQSALPGHLLPFCMNLLAHHIPYDSLTLLHPHFDILTGPHPIYTLVPCFLAIFDSHRLARSWGEATTTRGRHLGRFD